MSATRKLARLASPGRLKNALLRREALVLKGAALALLNPVAAPVAPEVAEMPRGFDQKLQMWAYIAGLDHIVSGIPGDLSSGVRSGFADSGDALTRSRAMSDAELSRLSSADLATLAARLLTPSVDEVLRFDTPAAGEREDEFFRVVTAHGEDPGQVHDVLSRIPPPKRPIASAQRAAIELLDFAGAKLGFDTHFEPLVPWVLPLAGGLEQLSPAGEDRLRGLLERTRATPGDWEGYQRYLTALTAMPWREGSRVETFTDGQEAFKAMHEAVDGAKRSVHLTVWGFNSNDTGQDFARHLIQASERGCDVKLLVDSIGSRFGGNNLPNDGALFDKLRRHGVEVVQSEQGTLLSNGTHRKVMVVDGEVGFVGGMNIGDKYRDGGFADSQSRVLGPVVADLERAFLVQYADETDQAVSDLPPAAPPPPALPGGGGARVVPHEGLEDRAIQLAYLRAIETAEREIFIANPFVFDPAIIRHLEAAADRGVEVHVVVPAQHAWYQELTAATLGRAQGLHLHQYQAGTGKLHAKLAVFDGKYAMVGSANLNNRSHLDDELTVLFSGEEDVGQVRGAIAGYLAASTPFEDWTTQWKDVKSRIKEPWF